MSMKPNFSGTLTFFSAVMSGSERMRGESKNSLSTAKSSVALAPLTKRLKGPETKLGLENVSVLWVLKCSRL